MSANKALPTIVFAFLLGALSAVAAPLAGDVDGSGTLEAADIQSVVNSVLRNASGVGTDIDFDGVTDATDVQLVINACLDIRIDADEDGLSDAAESTLGTAKDLFDTDGDGVGDGEEVLAGTNPLRGSGGLAKADLAVLLRAGGDSATKQILKALLPEKRVVDTDDIESLVVTVTEVTLHYAGDNTHREDPVIVAVTNNAFSPADVTVEAGSRVRWLWLEDGYHTVTSGVFGEPDAGSDFDFSFDEEGDFGDVTFNTAPLSVAYFSEPDVADGMTGIVQVAPDPLPPVVPERVTVYRGAVDVDLRDLSELGLLITAAEVPAGQYTKIVLSITNPRLTLTSDPATVIENVKLTANGRLFVSRPFVIPGGGPQILTLTFADLHLVLQGNGRYNLTPQLRANLESEPALMETEVEGIVTDLGYLAGLLTLQVGSESLTVDATQATVVPSPGDPLWTVRPGGWPVGAEAYAVGTLSPGGILVATTVEVALPAP